MTSALDWLYRSCCTSPLRRALTVHLVWWAAALLFAALWWVIHVFRWVGDYPLWIWALLASLVAGAIAASFVWLLLQIIVVHQRAVDAHIAQLQMHMVALREHNERVRNHLETIAHAAFASNEQKLFAVLQQSVTGIERELRAITPAELQPPPGRLVRRAMEG